MEYNGIAAKRRKKLKSYCFYAPFASLRGYSLSDSVVYATAFSVIRKSAACRGEELRRSPLCRGTLQSLRQFLHDPALVGEASAVRVARQTLLATT